MIGSLPGIERVYSRQEFAREFRSFPARIGELVAIGDKTTVFGSMDEESKQLPSQYRSHGCLVEASVPLVVFNASKAPDSEAFRYNLDLTRWLTVA